VGFLGFPHEIIINGEVEMPIKYDQYVKRPREELEYTEEQIIELQKCQQDLYHFIKYVKIINPDRGEIPYEPYDFQLELFNDFLNNRFCISLCARQVGKCSGGNTKIKIRNKKTGKMENISIENFFNKFKINT